MYTHIVHTHVHTYMQIERKGGRGIQGEKRKFTEVCQNTLQGPTWSHNRRKLFVYTWMTEEESSQTLDNNAITQSYNYVHKYTRTYRHTRMHACTHAHTHTQHTHNTQYTQAHTSTHHGRPTQKLNNYIRIFILNLCLSKTSKNEHAKQACWHVCVVYTHCQQERPLPQLSW